MARYDPQSLLSLLEQHEQPLVRYTLSLTRDLESARDIVQDAFLELARHSPLPDGRAAPWLFTVCRNGAIDLSRHRSRSTALRTEDFPVVQPDSPAVELTAKDDRRLLLQLLNELAPEKREVLLLRIDGELSYREISHVTGHTVSYVGVLIHEAVKTLRVRWRQLVPL